MLGGEGIDVSIEEEQDPWGDGPSENIVGAGLVLDTLAPKTPEAMRVLPEQPVRDSFAMLMEGAEELFALGDFSGSLETVEKALEIKSDEPKALAFLTRIKETLLKMYESKLGGITKRPRVRVNPSEIMWLNIDHRAGFVLSQIDGMVSYDEVLALSGMSRFDTCRILATLLEEGVIESV